MFKTALFLFAWLYSISSYAICTKPFYKVTTDDILRYADCLDKERVREFESRVREYEQRIEKMELEKKLMVPKMV